MAGSSSPYWEFQLPSWRPACKLWPCLPAPTSAADCWRYPCVCLSVYLPTYVINRLTYTFSGGL